MALGLGQNWKRVRKVIHMGRGDPSNICQMMGHCGRDGRPGLAVLFMEKNRRNGKNSIDDFTGIKEQSDDVRMDALAMTPVCLRIAFSCDNLKGHIPMSKDDIRYLEEEQREIEEGFPKCQCSNCLPEEATQLYKNMRELTLDNFSDAIVDPDLLPSTNYVPFDGPSRRRGPQKKELPVVLLEFAGSLVEQFETFFWETFPEAASFLPHDLFNLEQAENIARHLPEINSSDDILVDIGGGSVEGQVEFIYECVVKFCQGNIFHNHVVDEGEKRKQTEIDKKAKRQKVRSKANGKSDEQIEEERTRLAEKHATAEVEKARKLVAAEKRRNETIKRKEIAEREKEEKKRKWEQDKVYLEGYKQLAQESSASKNPSVPKTAPKVKPKPRKVVSEAPSASNVVQQ
ncbi:uncharacterized protein PGTG_00209 [Puccinia graminis f. sp. tritici CRL 75-36-700-3]|uniref:DNA 3'-5' helicase n=1 Tax=Puccinia graminis f. sp. tritici (strain CRL 75-36-700-3 / race SCCL) TaxID=418459 RepID=E3JRG4_PUCGT|nr:uncharacterized protein PGTG_00209 [Puccinia graminis f. sp. tritici CRL 75-36-700-3]EFP74253.1 hypothetical protein PGTG_00209 [Puccinia graminis f. sp. tritici CRL 75-36-700-3]